MIMPGPEGDVVRSTGGQVDDMTLALIDAAHDRDADAREVIAESLFELGKRRPALVLSSCLSYLKKHAKLSLDHRIVILNCMERIIRECLESLDSALALELIHQSAQELTQTKEVEPEWQTAASGVLVALGVRYCDDVMGELLERFQPGTLPHFFVVQTMGNLAAANVFGMVPHLIAVLGTMLPMLGMAKQDNMRWVFSAAIGKFAEAILEYVANMDKAPDKSVSKERFADEIFSVYDILFNVWLQSKEVKLRLAIVDALGHMIHIMNHDKMEEQFPRILQGIMGLYRRHPEPYHITKGLCMVLDVACVEGSTVLDLHFDNVLNTLLAQVFAPVDFNNPMSIRNHNETLRSFAILTRTYSGKLVGVLLQKLEANNEKTRIGILSIFKHIINSSEAAMEDKKEVVVSGLKMLCSETNNKVKKVFAQVVITMANHGYLALEGGHLMIEFVVRQCALPDDPPGKKSNDPEFVTNKALRTMCDHILQLITTTIEHMEFVLWPYLLELVVPEMYTEALGAVCRSLAHLAAKKREEKADDFDLDYEIQANLPRPTQLLARLLVMVGHPQSGRNRGMHILALLQAVSPNLQDSLVELWDAVIPKLVQFLEEKTQGGEEEEWSQKNWEDLLLKMLSKSLDVVDNEEWTAELGEMMGSQVSMYAHMPEEKNFLYKCLGIIMRKSTKKEFVTKHLDLAFSTVKHSDQTEREGCAIATGFCAASHLDTVLTKLEQVAKNDMVKKSSGLFGLLKDKGEGDEQVKATLMLCHGFVALYSPPQLIISRMEATILRTIAPHFSNVKTVELRRNLIRTIDLLGQAVHPENLQTPHSFPLRQELLGHLQSYMKAEPTNQLTNETRALAMSACATLVKLDPPLMEAEVFDLIKVSTDCLLPLPPDGLALRKRKEESYNDVLESEVLLSSSLDALQELLQELLLKDFSPSGLDSIFKHLVPWILSAQEYERERAILIWSRLLTFFLDTLQDSPGGTFMGEGLYLARLVPRCTDPNITIRQLAIDCIQLTLRISLRFQGNPADHKDQMVEALPTLKERLKKGDPNVLFMVVNDLSKVISKKLPGSQLEVFLDTLLDSLLDSQSHSSSGACVVLNGLMKQRGAEVLSKVDNLLHELHEKLKQIQFDQTRTGTLRTIRTMASHHLIPTLTSLLSYPLPFDQHVVEIWKILAQDTQLTTCMLDHILEQFAKLLPYEEKPDPRDKEKTLRTASSVPLAMTCAVKEIFLVEETEEVVLRNFHRLFAALMVRIGSTVNVNPPKPQAEREEGKSKDKKKTAARETSKPVSPNKTAIEAMREFLVRAKADDLIEILDNEEAWKLMEDESDYPKAITILARALVSCPDQAQFTSKIVASLTSTLSSIYDPQRVVVAAFFAELINQRCLGDGSMVELIMNSLLGRLVDSSHVVRMLCIRGLGNVASVGKDQVQRYSTTILSAMMAGMDDKEDPEDDITLEAMSGLSRILSEIDESHIRAILINVALKIRPCFEKDKPAVRAQAIILFGNLSRFGDGPSKAPFLEQIHSNFISLLLHLNDPEDEVKKACKYSLKLLGPLMESEATNEKFQRHLLDDARLLYGEFMNDLSKLLIQDFPEKVNFYVMGCVGFLKSSWAEIRSNAAMFIGFLLGNLPKDKQASISKEHVCSALMLLLKDSSGTVRGKAAEAISLLYEY